MVGNKHFFLVFFSLLLFLNACKKNDETINLHLDYFPLEIGSFIEYDVTQIKHNIESDTSYYKLKVVIGDTTIDNSGRIVKKYYRYIFDTILNEYRPKDLWTATIEDNRAELVEENKLKIKMVFQPTAEKRWNINAFNYDAEKIAHFENIHDAYEINGHSFEETVKVVSEYKEANLIEEINAYEVYAKGVGLIELHYKKIEYDDFNYLDPNSGEELYYKIINYGKE